MKSHGEKWEEDEPTGLLAGVSGMKLLVFVWVEGRLMGEFVSEFIGFELGIEIGFEEIKQSDGLIGRDLKKNSVI